jgi:chromosome segregation ATPase
MEYGLIAQDTTAAAAAIRSLQAQLRDLRAENAKLTEELQAAGRANAGLQESYERQLENTRIDFSNKESAMKEDIVYLCQRVQFLEKDNLVLINDGHSLKSQVFESSQSMRMIEMLKEELQMASKKVQQKETEIELLNRRISQLEGGKGKEKASEGAENRGKASVERNFEVQAERLDGELGEMKAEYRELLRNPQHNSSEWKERVEELRKAIENRSQELLRIRREQYEQLRESMGEQ